MDHLKTNKNPLVNILPYLVFFAGLFIFFGFFADYIQFYQEKNSLFIFSYDFLVENLHQPGGFIVWLGKFLTTFFYYPLAGALIISALITLIVLAISRVISLLSSKNTNSIPFIVGLVLFYLQTDYRFLILNNIGLLLQTSLFFLAVKYLTNLKGWIPVLIVPLWYFISGGFSWIFSVMLISWFALNKEKSRWLKIAATAALNLITLYISAEFLFFQNWKALLLFPFIELNTSSQTAVFLSVVIILSLLPLIAKITPGTFVIKKLKGDYLTLYIVPILLCIFLIIIGVLQYDKKVRQYFIVEDLFYKRRYNEVISFNTEHPSTNILTIFLNNIALSETNRLNDQLFNFPQSKDGSTLFLKWEMVGEILRRGGYFYYTIGMINEAHRWAFENMVMKGLSPEGLKMLIKTDLINGNYNVASGYIALLKKTAFYNKEARYFEKFLFNDSAVNSDKDLGQKRQIRLETDFFSITDDPFVNIERILTVDTLNRKAFEYKMAWLLIKKDYQGITNALPQFGHYGFTRFPVNVEEAIVALTALNNGISPYLGNIRVSQNTEARWTQFLTVFQRYGNDLKKAEPALRSQFRNTYWYYIFYR